MHQIQLPQFLIFNLLRYPQGLHGCPVLTHINITLLCYFHFIDYSAVRELMCYSVLAGLNSVCLFEQNTRFAGLILRILCLFPVILLEFVAHCIVYQYYLKIL